VSKIDADRERQRLNKLYAAMSDGELEMLGTDPAALTEWARQALRAEMVRRGLKWQEQSLSALGRPPSQDDVLMPLRAYTDLAKVAPDVELLKGAGIRTHCLRRGDTATEEVSLLVRAADLADAIQLLRNRGRDEELSAAAEPQPEHAAGKPVVLRRYRDITEAMVDRSALESAGIECFLYDDNLIRLDWFVSNAIGGAKLVVSERDAAEAEKILEQARPLEE
jgi:hypothetical protein